MPMATEYCPMPELMLIKSSGAEVAIETTVRPITTFDILNFNDKSTEDFNK